MDSIIYLFSMVFIVGYVSILILVLVGVPWVFLCG